MVKETVDFSAEMRVPTLTFAYRMQITDDISRKCLPNTSIRIFLSDEYQNLKITFNCHLENEKYIRLFVIFTSLFANKNNILTGAEEGRLVLHLTDNNFINARIFILFSSMDVNNPLIIVFVDSRKYSNTDTDTFRNIPQLIHQ